MLSAVSGGALVGMLLAGLRKKQNRRGLMLLILVGVLGLGMASLAFMLPLWGIAAILAAMGIASGFVNIQIVSRMRAKVDRQLKGRVMSVLMFAAVGLAPISLGFAGAIAQLHLAVMFAVAGCLIVISAVVAGSNPATRQID
jgi:MFS family permease